MRYRERRDEGTSDSFSLQGFCYNPQTGYNPSCPVDDQTITYTDTYGYEAMVDTPTPEFKRLSAEGHVIGNHMYTMKYTAYAQPSTVVWEFTDLTKNWGYPTFTNGYQYSSIPEIPTTLKEQDWGLKLDYWLNQYESERQVAIAKAWANVDESELLAWATIGEMPETLQWIANLYRRGIRILSLFKSRRLKATVNRALRRMSAKEYADEISNLWLELRYAVRPLLFEMEQIVNALQAGGKPPRRTARGFHDVEEIDSGVKTLEVDSSRRLTVNYNSKRESTYRAGVLYEIRTTDKAWLEVLGLDKPLESMWELTKLSFLIDWFLNVGDVLAAHTTSANLTPLASWVTESHQLILTERDTEFWREENPSWSAEKLSQTLGKRGYSYEVKRRLMTPDKPVIPSVSINLDWTKVVDLAAIARSIYRAIR